MNRLNNFDAIRLLGAVAVIVGHSYVLLGEVAPRVVGVPIHTLGVAVFFCVSGFLIAGSSDRATTITRFLWHRVLRIFPALFVVVLVSVFVIGPLVTTLPVSSYLASGLTWKYLLNLLLLAQYELPGVFSSDEHVRGAVNGSLWTLGLEFCCYLVVAVIWFLPRRLRGFAYCLTCVPLVLVAVSSSGAASSAVLCVYFAVAAALSSFRANQLLGLPLALASAVALVLASGSPAMQWCLWIALPVLVVSVGAGSMPVVRRAARYGDFSYGLYLWGYPLQQVIIVQFGVLSIAANLVLLIGICLVVAGCSWWFVEKEALKFKGYFRPRLAVG